MNDEKLVKQDAELASSYKIMIESFPWRDLLDRINEKLDNQKRGFLQKEALDVDLMVAGEYRGWNQAFEWLFKEVDFIVSGGIHAKSDGT